MNRVTVGLMVFLAIGSVARAEVTFDKEWTVEVWAEAKSAAPVSDAAASDYWRDLALKKVVTSYKKYTATAALMAYWKVGTANTEARIGGLISMLDSVLNSGHVIDANSEYCVHVCKANGLAQLGRAADAIVELDWMIANCPVDYYGETFIGGVLETINYIERIAPITNKSSKIATALVAHLVPLAGSNVEKAYDMVLKGPLMTDEQYVIFHKGLLQRVQAREENVPFIQRVKNQLVKEK